MSHSKIIELRVHTELLSATGHRPEREKPSSQEKLPKWPRCALVLDCETTIDEHQSLTFGCFHYCRSDGSGYEILLEGLFYADHLDPEAVTLLLNYSKAHNLQCLSHSVFMKKVFWRAIRAEALIVGFNLPFDLSRLARASCWTTRRGGAWSFTMSQYKDPDTGRLLEDKFKPRIVIKPKDGKGSFFRLTRCRDPRQYPPLRCLDLKTLLWALHSKSYDLDSACKACGVEGKLPHTPTGFVTVEEVEYNRQDVRATVGLLNAARAEFDRHPIDLKPDETYSTASMVKAYFKKMGLQRPNEKFDLGPRITGNAMQSYYGGRAECRIRHTPVPIVHLDFLSQYPTVNTLMGLWPLLRAKRLRIEEATEEVRHLLANLTLADTFDPQFWKRLRFFALVQPTGDIVLVRTAYNNRTSNIGVNPLTSNEPIWYASPDLVVAKLLTGRPPTIVRAIRLIPEGLQEGLGSVALRNKIVIDPRTQDFFRTIIEERARVKSDQSQTENERKALSYFLKILANAGSYGLFVEVNPEKVENNPKTGLPKRAKLRVFAGEQVFETTSEIVEKLGLWYFPPLGALITAGGRLLLAMLEQTVADAGGSYLLCDTDSMAIVASKDGGLVPCAGGPHLLPDGSDAVKALSWEEVHSIVTKFECLNPYDHETVPGSILKIEDVNFGPDGKQRQLYGYAIAAKRYALFTRTPDGDIRIVKASAHGLGFLYSPKPGFDDSADAPAWVVEAWDWILRDALGLGAAEPSWFSLPAMMRIAITTPEVLKALQAHQAELPYRDQTKPFGFVLSPTIDKLTGGYLVGADPDKFTLIAPFTSDPSRWNQLTWTNVHDGKSYRLAQPGKRLPSDAEPQTYRDVVSRYRWHPEAKSLAPDGNACRSHTAGLLQRTPVTADGFRYIGKETDRRWEQGEDFSLLEPLTVEYRPNETERLVVLDPKFLHNRKISKRALAKLSGVSVKRVRAALNGQRIRKSTADRLAKALKVPGTLGC